MAVAYSIASLS